MKQRMKPVIDSRKTVINSNSASNVDQKVPPVVFMAMPVVNNIFLITDLAHGDCDTSNMTSSASEVLHKKPQVECRSISFVDSGLNIYGAKKIFSLPWT